MPSKTGVATLKPSALAATPRCVSSTWPTFIREGTPSGLRHDVDRSAVREERHVFFRHDLGDDALVAVAAGHLVADRELALRGDVDLHLLDDAGIDVVAALDAVHRALVLELELGELVLELADDLEDLVADRRRIDVDVIVDRRQLAQERLGDLAVGRDDDFAGLGVDHVERDLLAEEDVRERLGELLVQLVLLLGCSSSICLS